MPGDDPEDEPGATTALRRAASPTVADPRRAGRETRPRQWDLVAAVAVGGVLGAEARYGVDRALPHPVSQFPWPTVIINVTGSLVIGVAMVIFLELTSPHRLARPFLAVGILGGYTTYSAFAVDTQRLFAAHRPLVALIYVVVSVVGCLVAVMAASAGTRVTGEAIIRARRRNPGRPR